MINVVVRIKNKNDGEKILFFQYNLDSERQAIEHAIGPLISQEYKIERIDTFIGPTNRWRVDIPPPLPAYEIVQL
jgi:hypothetical protein